jgi:transposase
MATIQSKVSRGHRYWYIVESRRVNGKPRPEVLAYLGKPEDLLRRLEDLAGSLAVKSYSHGAVAALLETAAVLQIPELINRYVQSSKSYMSKKPIRHHLTVGITLLLGAIGRVCMPTSKRGWWTWAQTTSCEYLLRCNLSGIDSQHFWDLMDALPVDSIELIEKELLQRVRAHYALPTDTLFYDTTNFYTYIATTNSRCTIAKRGKNKQKRHDLRQVGLAMVVTREDLIPLFHLSYEGNRHDCRVFQQVAQSIKQRLLDVGMELEKHTLVFDRGNNSKENLNQVKEMELHYVGALTPVHHQTLIHQAQQGFELIHVKDEALQVFRDQREIWGESRTVVVYLSEQLKDGQLRGLQQTLDKKIDKLNQLQSALTRANAPRYNQINLEARITNLVKGQYLKHVIDWSLTEPSDGQFRLEHSINLDELTKVKKQLGFRILMTDRHDWSTEEIIQAYHGQSQVELAFKNLKNPYHLSLKPQFHWTDQKIRVHYFMCVLGYLLSTLVWKQVRQKANFKGSLGTLLNTLNFIRLATLIEKTSKQGKPKVRYQLETMSNQDKAILEALGIQSTHLKHPQFKGVGVYTSDAT